MTVLVADGNAGDRTLRAPLAAALADQGLGVLLFDYRGYGGNPGSPSEHGLALDVRAAHRFLVDEAGRAAAPAPVLRREPGRCRRRRAGHRTPARRSRAAVPVRRPRRGRAGCTTRSSRSGALLRDRFPTAEYVGRITVPITVVYGSEDSIVPAEQSRAVAAAVRDHVNTVAVAGADHNDRALLDGPELIDAVITAA